MKNPLSSAADSIRLALKPEHPETRTSSRITAFLLTAGTFILAVNEKDVSAAAYGLSTIFYLHAKNDEIGAIAPLVRDQITPDI